MIRKKATPKELLCQYKAMDIMTLSIAHKSISKCGVDKYHASGVIIDIKDIRGKPLFDSFGIVDGLSKETIEAIKKDIEKSHKHRIEMSKL